MGLYNSTSRFENCEENVVREKEAGDNNVTTLTSEQIVNGVNFPGKFELPIWLFKL